MARLLSVPYCLVAGLQDGEMAGGGEKGRDGGGSALICCCIRKITFFINVSIWTFAIFGCLSSLTYCMNLMRFKSK